MATEKQYGVYAYVKSLKKERRITTKPSSKNEAEDMIKYYKKTMSEDWLAKYKEWKVKLWK
jgi:hypothetical protein